MPSTGGIQGNDANPHLPETPEEQVEQTLEAYQPGALMVHLHARDPKKWRDGADAAERYRKVNGMIREACREIIIKNTSGGSLGMTVEQRVAYLDAGPEVATLNRGPDMCKFKERKPRLPHPRPEEDAEGVLSVTYGELRPMDVGIALTSKPATPVSCSIAPGGVWGDKKVTHVVARSYAQELSTWTV